MEWTNRGERPSQPVVSSSANPAAATGKKKKDKNKLARIAVAIIVGGAAILLACLALFAFFGPSNSEYQYVNKKGLQAVFLNGGQVYFGHITVLNEQYMNVSGIYYLRVNQTVQPNGTANNSQDVSLVKLGCELHGPQDRMTITRDQVIFWENLKSDGQVAKAVDQFVQQNPKGQTCQTSATTTTTDKKQ